MQCARAILSSGAWNALQYFSALSHYLIVSLSHCLNISISLSHCLIISLSHYLIISLSHYLIKRTIFGKTKFIEHKVFRFYLQVFLKYLSFYKEMSAVWSKMYIGSPTKYRWSCHIGIKLAFSRQIFEKYAIPWKSVHLETSCFVRTHGQTDGQTDMTKLIVAFRDFANAPKSLTKLRATQRRRSS
jgi:hypothetical protein